MPIFGQFRPPPRGGSRDPKLTKNDPPGVNFGSLGGGGSKLSKMEVPVTKFRNFVTGGSISHKVPKNLEFGENSYLKWQFYEESVMVIGMCLDMMLL